MESWIRYEKRCLCILNIDPLLVNIICKYFLPFSMLSSHFVNDSFCCAKAFNFTRSYLFIFAFFFCLGRHIPQNIAMMYVKECSTFETPLVSSGRFMVSGLTFRFLVHFELIFVYAVRKCSNFIHSHVAVQFPQQNLLKKVSFLHCIYFFLFLS